MAKQIDPIKKLKYKQNRLKGKSITQSLKDAGYSPNSAVHSSGLGVVKCIEPQIALELTEADITVELIINRLNEDRLRALAKQDYATATRVDELLGKYLAMFTDKSEINNKNPDKIIISYTETKPRTAQDERQNNNQSPL